MAKKIEDLAKAVYEILVDVYEHSPWTYEQVLADMKSPNVEYFYAYQAGEIVGFLSLLHLAGEYELTNIAVKKVYQDKGLGRFLLNHLTEIAGAVFLEVRASNHKAHALYEVMGFEVVGKRRNYYHDPVEDAILMRKDGR